MFFMFFFAGLASIFFSWSHRVNQSMEQAEQQLLIKQVVMLAEVLGQDAGQHPFKSEKQVDINELRSFPTLSIKWLADQTRIFRNQYGFFIQVVSPKPGWAKAFINQTSVPICVQSDQSVALEHQTDFDFRRAKVIAYRVGYVVADQQINFIYCPVDQTPPFELKVPSDITVGSLVIYIPCF